MLLFRITASAILVAASLQAVATDLEDELNGWRLQQFSSISAQMGAPFKTVEDPPLKFSAYRVDSDAYMVVGVDADQPNNIATLQLTGKISPQMRPFRGLRLGDGREKVLAALGQPTEVVEIAEPKVSRLSYEGRNYSVELDDEGNLYSIRIQINAEFMAVKEDREEPWTDFVAAVRSGDSSLLLPQLRPDVEVYRDGQTLSIQRRYSDFAASPDAALLDAFFSRSSGVRRYLDVCEPEGLVRVTERMGVGLVFKFQSDCALEEIVMFPHAGQYRVYEVAFRQGRHSYGTAWEAGR